MKKILSVLLAVVLVLGLCACGSASAGNENPGTAGDTAGGNAGAAGGLQVGYAIVNITPTESVPLGGYGNTSMRMSTGYQSYLYTTCVAYSDGEDTILVFQNDHVGTNAGIVENARERINSELGIPTTNIMSAATHTHSAPDLGNSAEPTIATYREQFVNWMVEAAQEAVEDLKPVTGMYYGETYPENLNFVRHYTTEAGIVKGDNFGDLVNSPYTGHTHKADNQLQVIKIERDGGKPVVLVNWQSHPHRGGGSKNYNITADIVGAMRDQVQAGYDCLFAYYTGASGNVNPSSRISEENITKDYKEQGAKLGDHALSVLNGEMVERKTGNVQIARKVYTGEVNHTEDHLITYAHEVSELWAQTNDFIKCVTLANSYGINSPYHANGIISKANQPYTYDVEYFAISVGDLAFVTAPYEMYDENGKFIKENSPFETTFVITLCNNGVGYIPSVEGYKNNSYEANTGKFVPGTGEIMADNYVALLNELYPTK